MTENACQVSVIFPCLNEVEIVGGCVAEAVEALSGAGIDHEVIVVDNGSTDGSADAARAAGARVVSEPSRGYGAAVSRGIEVSRGGVIVTSDADGTYPMEALPVLVREAQSSGTLVLGSRFRGRIAPGSMPLLHRLVGSPATRILLRFLLGVRSSDPHTGMRAMPREVFASVRPASRGWEFTVEMLVNAKRRSVPVREVGIDYNPRVGASKLRALPEGWAFFRFLVLHSPAFLFVVPGALSISVGVGLLAWLAPADRSVGAVNFGVNSLIVGALLTVAGYQIVTLGVSARVYMSQSLDHKAPRRYGGFTLERGIIFGLLLVAGGLAAVAGVAARWVSLDLGPLPRSHHGVVVTGLTLAVVGMQTVFSSFFVSLMTGEPPHGDGDG